jgi:Flp pilus assembly protein CpaB
VTLLVTPPQAEALQLATFNGRPWLVLRNARDTAPIESAGTSLADCGARRARRPSRWRP